MKSIDSTDFTIVTTYSEEGWQKYGYRFANSMDMYLPSDIDVLLYYEGNSSPDGFSERMKFLSFNELCGEKQKRFELMEQSFKNDNDVDSAHEAEFKYQASRFAHKYYTCESAVNRVSTKYLIWIDADVIALRKIPKNFFKSLVSNNSYWSRIGRGDEYPECGFMIWDRQHKMHKFFWEIMNTMYDKGQLFNLKEWHDSYVWWEAEKILQKTKSVNIGFDLGDGGEGHAFVRGVLGKYFDHLKGPRKIFGFSPEKKSIIHKILYLLFFYSMKIIKKLKIRKF